MIRSNIIINADDFGLSEEVNSAIDHSFKNGYIDRATLIINTSYVDHAIELAKAGDYLDRIGLHLNIVEGKPLTDDIKDTIFCTNGYFNGRFLKQVLSRFYINRGAREALKKEIEAQIDLFIKKGCTLKHLDSHKHAHTSPSILMILIPILDKYEFSSIRYSRNIYRRNVAWYKMIIKRWINYQIKRYNGKRGIDINCNKFGTVCDFEDYINDNTFKAELMVHPIMKNGEFLDSINILSVKAWLEKYDIK